MVDLLALPHQLDRQALTCRAVVETQRGHRSKFDYHPESGLFELARVLPAGMAFPLAVGFIPGTLAEDGDPVDILVLADEDLPVGALVKVRLLNVIEAEQTEEGQTCRNDEDEASASLEDRVARARTAFTGSMRFVYLHLPIYGAWIIVNVERLPGIKPFDPSFVILASEASVEAIFLSTFVLISQNKMQEAADKRADLDLHINLLAEHELTKLATVINAMARKMDVQVPSEMDEVERDVAPEAVLDEIEATQPADPAQP